MVTYAVEVGAGKEAQSHGDGNIVSKLEHVLAKDFGQEAHRMEAGTSKVEEGCSCGIPSLRRISQRIDQGISEFFRREGAFVAQHPFLVILLSLLLTALTAIPLIEKVAPGKGLVAFHEEADKDNLYAPKGFRGISDRDYVSELYEREPLIQLVLVAKNQSSPSLNILTREHISEAWDMWEAIQAIEVTVDGEKYKWDDICVRNSIPGSDEVAPCKMFSIFDAWDMNRTLFTNDENFLDTLTKKTVAHGQDLLLGVARRASNEYGAPLFRDLILGTDFVEEDENGILKSAEVFRITLMKRNEVREIRGKRYDPVTDEWEAAMIDLVVYDWEGKLRGFAGSFEEVDKQSEAQVHKDTLWAGGSYLLVILASHFILFRNNRAFCKSHLTMISVVAISMSIVTAIGLVNLMRVPYNLVVNTVPFLMVGLGIDDTFVIMGAYAATPPYHTAQQRIEETMMRAGTSILITSLTDFAAFAFGTFTTIPAVQAFCVYAAAGVLFDFLYQVTFFVAFVVLDTRREERSRRGASFFGFGRLAIGAPSPVVLPPKSQEMRRMDVKPAEPPENIANPVMKQVVNRKRTWEKKFSLTEWKLLQGEEYPKCCGEGEFDPQQPSPGRRIIGEWLPKVTLHPLGMAAVLLIEACVLGLAIYGCTKVYMDFRYTEWFVPKGSWLNDAFAIEDKYFGGTKTNFHIYTKEPLDGSDYFDHLDELEALGAAMHANPYIADRPLPFTSWYDNFALWANFFKAPEIVNGRPPNSTAFTEWVNEFLSTSGEAHLSDVIFNEDRTRIVSTRMMAFTVAIGPMSELIGIVDNVQEAAEEAAPNLQAFAFGYVFPYIDSFRIVIEETVKNVLSAMGAVFVICLLVLADFITTVAVVLMVALTDVWVFGSMWYWGLQFNIVTAINIILAVGIAVDYSAHVAHSFLVVEGTRRERAKKALYHIGGEVFAGASTTLLAVMALAFAQHYIFNVFFEMFTAIIIAGIWHGLIVLPVVLSVMGSQSYGGST